MDVNNVFKKVMATLWPEDAQKSKITLSNPAAFLIASEMVLRGYNFAISKTGSAYVAHFEAPPYVFGIKADTPGRAIVLAAGKALGLLAEPEPTKPQVSDEDPKQNQKKKTKGK